VFFPFLRMLDACIGLYAIPAAWLSRSSGRWKSPARRAVEPAASPGEAEAASRGPDPDTLPAGAVPADTVPADTVPADTLNSRARVAEAHHVCR
jgi:hypothetical protein